MKTSPDWKTAPISPVCEVLRNTHAKEYDEKVCGLPAFAAYKAAGGGWMALCAAHALKHGEATHIETLIQDGERFA